MTDHTSPTVPRGRPRLRGARRPAGAFWALVACAALTACGSSSPASSPASAQQDAFKFSRCMREHGITNFPDPESGPNGQVRLQFKTGAKLNQHALEVARGACRKYSPVNRMKLTPAQKVELEESVRKFAKCMREHGVNVPTPDTSAGGVRIELGKPGAGGPNPESPAFQTAQKACAGLLPKRPGGGPGGGAAPSTSTSSAKGGGSGFALGAGG